MRKPLALNHPDRRLPPPPTSPIISHSERRKQLPHPSSFSPKAHQKFNHLPSSNSTFPLSPTDPSERRFPRSPVVTPKAHQKFNQIPPSKPIPLSPTDHSERRFPPPLSVTPKSRQRFNHWPPNPIQLSPTDTVYAQPYGHQHLHQHQQLQLQQQQQQQQQQQHQQQQIPSTSTPAATTSTSTSSSQRGEEIFQPVKVIGIANINEKRDFTLPQKRPSKIRWYSNLIFNYPATVLAVTLLLFCALPLTILQIFPLSLDQNPEKGFDTRGTEYSNARLTWTKLQPFLVQGSRVIIHQPPPPLEELKIIEPLKILEERQKMSKADNRSKRSFEDELAALSSVQKILCEYSGMGGEQGRI
uniref:Uncharacterized protein n=1 Tax=Panagrolaimus superbus TaxID=310955 RepID=A0A914YG17_9BILA